MMELSVKQKGIEKTPETDLEDFLSRFIATVDAAETTRTSYRRKVRQFFRWMEETGTTSPRREDILRYRADLKARGKSPSTISVYLTAVRLFFSWMESEGQYPNIAAGVKGAKRRQGFKKETLLPDQIKAILETFDRSTAQGRRDFAIVNTLFRTGLRTAELASATVVDLRQEGGAAVLDILGKGHQEKDQFVIITEETAGPIRETLADRGTLQEEAPLFCSLSNNHHGKPLTTRAVRGIVKGSFLAAGLNSPKLTAHSTRHSFATIALLNGAEPLQVKEALRHSNLETTMVYTHVLDRVKNAAENRFTLEATR